MEYFTLTHAVDNVETGRAFPQAVFKNPKRLEPNPILTANQAINGTYPPEDILPFDYLELDRGAKLTDLMSSSFGGNGFLVSEKLRNILEQSFIKDIKFYDVILFGQTGEIKGYYYLHSASCLREYIDYEKSTFYIGDILRNYIRELNFKPSNFSDLEKYQKKLPFAEELVCVKQYWLKGNFSFDLDLFQLSAYNYDFFISTKLKNLIAKNNITGIFIKPTLDFLKTP